jgi:hypothetical protein
MMLVGHVVWEDTEMHAGFWCGNLKDRDHVDDLVVDGRMILKWILKKERNGRVWSGLVWVRRGTDDGLL